MPRYFFSELALLVATLVSAWGCVPLQEQAPYSAVLAGQYQGYPPAYVYAPQPQWDAFAEPRPLTCVNLGGVVLKCH
jgi:hypothetical protein